MATRQFDEERGDRGFWNAIRASKDPTTVTVLLEDYAALAGLMAAFAGVALGHLTGSGYPDAIASLIIGLILGAVALFLVRESKALLVGERAEPELTNEIRQLVEADQAVQAVDEPLTMHLGPSEILLILEIRLRGDTLVEDAEASLTRVESAIRAKHPEVARVFLTVRSSARSGHETTSEPAGARR